MIAQNGDLIKPYAFNDTAFPRMWVDTAAELSVKKMLRAEKITSFVLINPRAGRREKDLTDQEVMRFINTTLSTPDIFSSALHSSKKNSKNVSKSSKQQTVILLVGSPDDIEHNKRFAHLPHVHDWTGKTSLSELIALVNLSRHVYAPDTGIVHIAHALGVPCDAVYKTTNPTVWGYTG